MLIMFKPWVLLFEPKITDATEKVKKSNGICKLCKFEF